MLYSFFNIINLQIQRSMGACSDKPERKDFTKTD